MIDLHGGQGSVSVTIRSNAADCHGEKRRDEAVSLSA